jgi:hypothetical protein
VGCFVDQRSRLQLPCRVEILQSFSYTGAHGLFALPHPDSGIEELLIGLVFPFRIANRCHQVVLLLQDVITNARQVGKLQIGVEIDFDHTMANGIRILLLAGSGSSMEDKEDGLVLFRAGLVFDECLVLAKQFRVQFHVARLVDSMNVAEACRDGEVRADFGQSGPDVVDVFGLRVERIVVNIFIIDPVLLTTSDANFLRIFSMLG